MDSDSSVIDLTGTADEASSDHDIEFVGETRLADIRAALTAVLRDDFDFDGTFAAVHEYGSGAPNPCISTKELGAIGLPLSTRDAEALRSQCQEVGGDGSGVWEMKGNDFCIDNPEWDPWLQGKLLATICQALDVYGEDVRALELDKLVLHTTGVISEQNEDLEENPTTFGTVHVILPSRFDGAVVKISHGELSQSFDVASRSHFSTAFISSYTTGVEHTMDGVESGCRLSLRYRLVQTSGGALPSLPDMNGATRRLRDLLTAWKDDDSSESPAVLACLLRNKYDLDTFGSDSLIGSDDFLLQHLQPVAQQLSFRVFVARVNYTMSGEGSIPRPYGHMSSDDMCDIEPSAADIRKVRMDPTTGEISVEEVVDVEGMPYEIQDLELDVKEVLNGLLNEGDFDSTETEREDTESFSVTQTWSRTVLLMWPQCRDLSFEIGDIVDYACDTLTQSDSHAGTAKERFLIDALITSAIKDQRKAQNKLRAKRALSIVTQTATRWNDLGRFLRVVGTCVGDTKLEIIGVDGFVSAYKIFEWVDLENVYASLLKAPESNLYRWELLTQLSTEECTNEVQHWCNEQRDIIIQSLAPVKKDDAESQWLITILKQKGPSFLQTTILAQLKSHPFRKAFWIRFIASLFEIQTDLSIPGSSPELWADIISDCMGHAIEKFPLFAVLKAAPHEPDVSALEVLIELCAATGNVPMCSALFKRMKSQSKQVQPKQPQPLQYYLPLAREIDRISRSNAGADVFTDFFSTAAKLICAKSTHTEDEMQVLGISLGRPSGVPFLKSFLDSNRVEDWANTRQTSLKTLLRSVSVTFMSMLPPAVASTQAELALIMDACLSKIIEYSLFPTPPPSHSTSQSGRRTKQVARKSTGRPQSKPAIHPVVNIASGLIDLCLEVGVGEPSYRRVLARLLKPPEWNPAAYMSEVLLPFLPLLRQSTSQHSITFEDGPCAQFIAKICILYARSIMVPKPTTGVLSDELRTIGCDSPDCDACQKLRRFFEGTGDTLCVESLIHREGRPLAHNKNYEHLKQQLHDAKVGQWDVMWKIRLNTPSRGSTLIIQKPMKMISYSQWLANSNQGRSLLANLGDVSKQKILLGADYDWVTGTIAGTCEPPPPAAPLAPSKPLGQSSNVLPNEGTRKRAIKGSEPPATTKKARVSM